jgi:hypothetical protein
MFPLDYVFARGNTGCAGSISDAGSWKGKVGSGTDQI